MGDPSGIGAEVTAKALARISGTGAGGGRRSADEASPGPAVVPVVFGDGPILARALADAGVELPVVGAGGPVPNGGAVVAMTALPARACRPGRPSPEGGAAQLAYLEAAFQAVTSGTAEALCTAPVSKAQVATALPGFVGHTEWLTELTGTKRSVMMLAGARLRVALVTNHLALAEVLEAVTPAEILATLAVTDAAMRRDFGLRRPRLAVCAMNPHAGEGGAFGDEEARVVEPAIARARRRGIAASGPYPADSVFFRAARGEFDAVVALYHDQGLIPVKLLDALLDDPAVNVTLGLPIVRTSPDHGVAYDLAGKGRASEASMVAALQLAARMAAGRRRRA
ncbi:4-hydroxythreonine-4-phosphate dehydrogenase [Anaeromyxobacter paludicola]|uniref:4-hydroxythreonine-4-phosphate dehydrogenase n=2 Tax=Anaeromyxobacter paludicola TaxID=2918171 RepID=A0ABM7XCT6_9BACT|nr:4-hydroxythreonine-4-phosphate dehydrogenase [Anaeromyxobacter paludicola]